MSATILDSTPNPGSTVRKDRERPTRSPADALPAAGLPPTAPSATGAPPLVRVAGPLARRFQQVCAAMIADALGIPYVVAEASDAPKQALRAWAAGRDAGERAIRRADLVIGLNPAPVA